MNRIDRMDIDLEKLVIIEELLPPTGKTFKFDFNGELSELNSLVKEFFENYLDVWEESDSGHEFHPIHISCCRCMKIGPLDELLDKMRTLSESRPRHQLRSHYDD